MIHYLGRVGGTKRAIRENDHFSHRSHYSRSWQEVNPQSRWNLNDQRQTIVFQPSIVFFQCGTQPRPIHLLKLFQRTNARVQFFLCSLPKTHLSHISHYKTRKTPNRRRDIIVTTTTIIITTVTQ